MRLSKALFALVPLAIGCSTAPSEVPHEFTAAMARWNDQHAVNYQLTIHRSCECPGTDPVRVTVVNSQVTSRIDLTTGQPITADLVQYFPDVPGLFTLVQDAYHRAHSVAATFNNPFGYPETANIDYIGNAVDDELSFAVTDFVKQ